MKTIRTEQQDGLKRNRPIKDWSGTRFGRLTALSLVERDVKYRNHKWLFRCDCGIEKVVPIRLVVTGHAASCGCLASEALAERNRTHGLTRSNPKEYRSWKDMRGRCNNPNDASYKDYGGRGIRVCREWDDFSVFLRDMGLRPDGKTLDRIDVNGDYQRENCRWAGHKEQARNKRNNVNIEIDGVTKTLAEWCVIYKTDSSKVRYRLDHGWSVKGAFTDGRYQRSNRACGATA